MPPNPREDPAVSCAMMNQDGDCGPCPGDRAERIVFFELPPVPVHCNVLWDSRAAALAAPAAPVRLAYFPDCGLIYNVLFDESLTRYRATYENALHFSPRFRKYAEELADRLVERYGIRDKNVIEIGCGDGHFLALLCDRGGNRGMGFDPGHDPGRAATARVGAMQILAEPYTARHAHYPVDLLACRHVLEHIGNPCAFLAGLSEPLRRHGAPVVYMEVPNALYTLRDMGVWDIIYEHCSYFTPASLPVLMQRAGFEVLRVAEAYGGQFLGVEARPAADPSAGDDARAAADDARAVRDLVDRFAEHYRAKRDQWAAALERLAPGEAVVWGAGSKGVMFLNALAVATERIEYVVDVNPRKTGKHVPGTGQEIVRPDALRRIAPRTVILMNPLYRAEVERSLAELGVVAEVRAA